MHCQITLISPFTSAPPPPPLSQQIWECVRATTAAPTYFKPLQKGAMLFGDGALLANNPTAVALAEARLIYPGVPVEAVVSIGEFRQCGPELALRRHCLQVFAGFKVPQNYMHLL
ncbi:hypothetical protein JKP88DRAFT_166335 [Tribonema minus]|uniref:PNPLA domain-containing protein n=1 Tax=Tribonema minus TaxID=303371 RepID=A0A835YSP3_9STRA|nr:hypothetical protein JKP88DRAFT_166335 [Tribonema minus]